MDILTVVGSKIGEYLVAGTIHQARYLFCFNSIVEDLKDEETNLKLKLADIKERAEREERNTKEIEKVVEKWLKDSGDVMADVQRLKADIELKESCLIGWCPNWGCSYSLSRKAAQKTSVMLKLQNSADNFRATEWAHLKPLPGIEFCARRRGFKSFKATKLASNQLIEALKNENTNLVGLYGPGGVGKTTLAKVVGQELQQQQVFDEVVMATVSHNPNIDVQKQLAEKLNLELKEVTKEERAKRLYLRFTQTKTKILVILDDVWDQNLDLMNEFGIPVDENLNGCKILLTTRGKQICDGMVCNSSIPLGYLEPEEGLALLKNHAGINDDDSTLIDVSKEVAGECKGLPLAIAAVGSALRGKDVDEWNLVSHKLKTAKLDDVDGIDRKVYACLKLSYDYLKDDNTKLCFLLCSLFPEDFEIDLEELVRYGVGLGWYQGVETIEKVRSLLRGMIKWLKNFSLLLDVGKEGFVKMHDIVRDVAICIGSKEMKFFNRAGTGLTKWPEDEGLEQCKVISLLGNKINVFRNGLVFPNLHILLLERYLFYKDRLGVTDQFFEGMTALKVATIIGGDLSIKSLQFSTNLEVLQLIRCDVKDMAFLGKLKKLQILCLEKSSFDEIPDDVADELSKLKLLDLDYYSKLRISLIKRFSQLQEFYGRMTWEVQGKNAECLSKDFTFPQLQRYDIEIEEKFSYRHRQGSRTNALSINNTEATSLIIFSALYQNVQYLYLKKVKGCQNILPNIDQRGLKELTVLELRKCEDLECIMDVSQHVKSQSLVMLSRLATLRLIDLQKLQWIWKAPAQHVDLQNLTEVEVFECNNLTYLFSLSQARSLLQLRSLKVQDCKKLEHIIAAKIDNNERRTNILERDEYIIALLMLKKLTLDSLPKLTSFCSECYFPTWQALDELALLSCPRLTVSADEFVQAKNLKYLIIRDCKDLECIMDASQHVKSQSFVMLSRLATLHLTNLRKLQWIWKAPAHHVDLRNIIEVEVGYCNNLTYIFSLSQVRSLLQLKSLVVSECEKLEHIIEAKIDNIGRRENIVEGDEYTIALPMLEKLKLESLPNLTALSSECYFLTCQALQKLSLINCPRLTCGADEFVQTKNLQYLCLEDIQGCQNILRSIDQRGFYELTTLIIRDCEDLECIMDASQYVGLQKTTAFLKLRELTLHSLPNLTTFYSKYDHSIWPALQRLTLIKCPRLISSTDEFVQNLAKHLELRNLTEVEVRDCNSLTYIFSLSQARSLVQLRSLVVSECEKLEHIIEAKIDNNGRRENIVEGDEYAIALPILEELTLASLPNLITFSSEGYFPTCQALQKLSLISCPDLTGGANQFMQNLTESLQYLYLEKVKGCQNILRSIDQRGFYKLSTLTIRDCEDIECILDASQCVGLQKTAALPKLRELTLESLPNLTTFYSKCDHSIWPALQKLTLINCPRLTSSIDEFVQNLAENLQFLCVERCCHLCDAIVALLKHGLKNLKELYIGDLGAQVGFQLSDIIVDGQESILFPSLKWLGLYGLREMEVLYKGPTHFFCNLQNLILLDVRDCNRLRHLLTPTLARNLLQLVELSIHRCSDLEQIIEEDEEEDHLPPVCFPKLETIDVQLCPKLKRLFHISVAPSLQKLVSVHLEEVRELEELFWHKDGAVVMNDNKIVMTELCELELKDLPNLTNCWPEGCQLTFPSLEFKTVENCPKLRTNFAAEELQTTSKGDASEDRNTKENSSTVGDANKRGDAN